VPECFVMELTKCPRLFRQVLLKGFLLGFAWEGGRNPVLAALFSLGSLFRMRLFPARFLAKCSRFVNCHPCVFFVGHYPQG